MGFFDRAFADQGGIKHAALAIRAQHVKNFFGSPCHEWDEVLGHCLRADKRRIAPIHPVVEIATRNLRDQAQERSGLVPHTFDACQVLWVGFENGGQRAEAAHHPVSNGIRVATGKGMEQKKFQYLMFLESVEAILEEGCAKTLTVSVMDCRRSILGHAAPIPVAF